mmetsp:Transcript_22193/g.55935  ORF Transcript_22193/g.55935 Transcript_22193/m.55935 type:complete len:152 (+) Transcript_22193:151-606(+)|eukprot:g4047.t1
MAVPSIAFPMVFFHMNRNKVWSRDKRLTREELGQFPEIWTTWERRCYRQYLDETEILSNRVTGGGDDVEHVYHTLSADVKRCRRSLAGCATIEHAHECHYRIKELTDVCMFSGVEHPRYFDDSKFHDIAAAAFKRLEEGRGRHEQLGVRGK